MLKNQVDWSNQSAVDNLIIQTKKHLSSLMKRDFPSVWNEIRSAVASKVKQIRQEEEERGSAIPQIDMKEIDRGTVSESQLNQIKEKGTVVIRQVIPQEQINRWYGELKDYLKDNDYENQEVDPDLDRYFSQLKNQKPQIFNVFWSKCQVKIRQDENLARAKKFLNHFWKYRDQEKRYFDYDSEIAYADRVRIRSAGDNTLGLSPHIDGGSVERWMDEANLKIYQKIFSGNWKDYNPFDGAFRNEVKNIPSPAVCRAFRTYQGWVALTAQGPGDGTLKLVPMLRESTAYLLLRPFLKDVSEEILCGAVPSKAQAIGKEWHQELLEGLVSIPLMNPGDTVWWHSDLIHAVEDQHQGKNESSVVYVGSAPVCQRNKDFLELQKPTFLKGMSSPDFAPENREVSYRNRANLEDLTDLGKKQMGFIPW